MNNIKATIGTYVNKLRNKLTMCAPIAVYLSQNYPKQHISCENTTDTYFHSLGFARKSYLPFGDNIFFQIFPLGAIDNSSKQQFKIMQKYTSQKQKYYDYPSMTLTPNGTLITAPVLFDALPAFINNGIYCDSTNTGSDLISGQTYKISNSSYINWKAFRGHFNSYMGEDPQSEKFFTTKPKGTEGYMSICQKNFGSRKISTVQKKQDAYSYVNGIEADFRGKEYDPKKHKAERYVSKRIYKLQNYAVADPLSIALADAQPGETRSCIAMGTSSATPFFFAINFSNSQGVNANVDFGYNRVQIRPNHLALSVSDITWYRSTDGLITATTATQSNHTRRCLCSYTMDRNTILPFFMHKDKGLNSERTSCFVVYPSYCGLSIQPGLHFPNNVQSSKQSPALRAIGSTVQLYVKNKRRTPTMQSWLQINKEAYSSDSSLPSNPNIFLQPNPPKWQNGDLRLTINNGTANFFYMPLYFVSKSRFRMYFKGIKGGQYYTNGVPHSSVTDNVTESTMCLKESAIQYKSQSKQQEDGTFKQEFTQFADHKYYGSLIYTTDYGASSGQIQTNENGGSYTNVDGPKATYITSPAQAYRMKPINDGEDKNFWDKYSMDSYYMDFNIDLNGTDNEYGDDKLPFVRTPLQVMGVLIMQKTKYESSLLQNSNGTFTVSSSTLYSISASYTDIGQLPITINAGSSTPVWSQYIQSINVSWNEQGGSGSITLDKYALFGQQMMPQQSIGGLSISMSGGNESILNISSSSASDRTASIFTGYGTKMSMQDSFTSDTITITLEGPQRKLTDLKLINPPFWDGDKLEDAYKWMAQYAGIDIKYDKKYFEPKTSFKCAADSVLNYLDQNGVVQKREAKDFPRFPTSSNFKRPAVYIKTGQDCFSVFKKLAELCNCRFVLQPDGRAYIMTQTKMAVPQMCDWTTKTIGGGGKNMGMGYRAVFNQNLILNYSVQPLLNNLHNYIITAAFKSANIGSKQGDSSGSIQAGFKANKKFRKLTTTPNIPWSKVKAFKHQGFMSQAKVLQQFDRDVYAVSSYWLSVKVTIPGNQMIWIYDIVNMFGIDYYVTDISHSIDLVGKKWTTQLTLSNVLKDLDEK